MKKFFKALAVVLALTLVLGTIPASAAAGDVSLKKTAKTLYIGGSQGAKADGTACKVGGAALFSKLVKGFDKKTMTISVESDNNDVAEASTKSSKVTAASIGTANVTVTVFEDGAEILKGVVAVNVKKNATAVTVAEGDIFDGAKVGVNTEYTVVLPRKSAGVFVDTDSRMIEASDDSVVITRVEGAPTTFTVVFTKEGEYTLTPVAYQSAKFPAVTAKGEPIKVSAALNPVSVTQASLSAVAVEFDCNVKGLVGAANFKANTEITGVEIPFSSIKSVEVKDGNETVATVEFYTPFTQGTEYTIKYNDKVVGKISAVKVADDSVVDITADDMKVYAETLTKIDTVKLLDAANIDLAGYVSAKGAFADRVTYKLVDADITKAFISNGSVYVKNAGETYTIEATYKYGTFEKSVKFQVVSEAKPAYEFTGIDADLSGAYEVGKYNVADLAADNKLKDVKKTVVSLSKNASGVSAELQIVAKFVKVENGETKTDFIGFDDATYGEFTAVSSDEAVVMLAAKSGCAYGLKPNKVGTATILIYQKVNGNDVVVGAVPVEVVAERKADSFTASPATNKINAAKGETTTVKFEILDQFKEAFADDKVTKATQTAGAEFAKVDTELAATGTIKATIVDSSKAYGDVTIEFETVKGLKYSCSVTVGNETETKSQKLVLSTPDNAGKLDTSILADTGITKATVEIKGITANGFFNKDDITPEMVNEDSALIVPGKVASMAATQYYYTISGLKTNSDTVIEGGVQAVKKAADGSAKKLAVGSYSVVAYKVYTVKSGSDIVKLVDVIGSDVFTVVDNQKQLAVKKVSESVADVTVDALLASAFEFSFNDNKDITVELVKTIDGETGAKKTAYVKSAKYVINNETLGKFTVETAIGALINNK